MLARGFRARSGAVAVVAALALFACGGGPAKRSGAASSRAAAAGSILERVELDDRPPLSLLNREGDPRAAVAFVVGHARGSAASAALGGLLLGRLEASGFPDVEVRAHALGIEVSRSFEQSAQVERFVQTVHNALRAEVRAGEPALARAQAALEAMRALAFLGPAEAAAAACSGELGLPDSAGPLELSHPTGVPRLEAARSAAYRAPASAFAAVGPPAALTDARTALSNDESWPTEAADADLWPSADSLGVDQASGARRLALALRVGDAEAAAFAGQRLGAIDSELITRLESLSPPWRLERTAAVARRRGACLRVDLAPPKGDPGPTPAEIARAAALARTALARALSSAEPGARDESVLVPTDPRRAAVLAAWRALPSETVDDPERRTLSYVADPSDRIEIKGLSQAIADVERRLSEPSFELFSRGEAGQGEIWMLLASPCGTSVENEEDAGARALLFRAIAAREQKSGVRFEPWATPDAVGILVHAPRIRPEEPADEHARRLAAELGRAMTRRLTGTDLGSPRAGLLAELGDQPFPGWSLLLHGLAPGHPSWLEPRGTWSSVSELSTESLDRARRALLSAPLRLAVLVNESESQANRAALELESWLVATRGQIGACAAPHAEAARRGELAIEPGVRPLLEGAYVGALLSGPGSGGVRAAELTAIFLNRPDGPLERALKEAGLGASARAIALGGAARPALAIHVRALPERLSEAVVKVRTLLDGLGRGLLASEDHAWAKAELARLEAEARFDPRRRIVELWRGKPPPELSLATLRAAHAGLAAASQWVVTADVLDPNKSPAK